MATKTKKPAQKTAPAVKPADTTRMYIGPTVARFGVIQNSVYSDIPETAKNIINELPIMGSLFIPLSRYPEAEKSLRMQDGYIWTAYQAVLEHAAKAKIS